MTKTIIITLITITVISGIIGYDYITISDQELQNYILNEIINGKIPKIDISRIELNRIFPAYIAVIEKNLSSKITQEDLIMKDFNLYNKIRREAQKNGYPIQSSEKIINEVKNKEDFK